MTCRALKAFGAVAGLLFNNERFLDSARNDKQPDAVAAV